MAAIQYDPQVLHQYADDLYRQAQSVLMWTAIKYGLLVFLISILAGGLFNSLRRGVGVPSSELAIIAVLTVLGVVVGIETGRLKAFNLKLEAQRLLCQLQIEQNTHPADEVTAPPAPE